MKHAPETQRLILNNTSWGLSYAIADRKCLNVPRLMQTLAKSHRVLTDIYAIGEVKDCVSKERFKDFLDLLDVAKVVSDEMEISFKDGNLADSYP